MQTLDNALECFVSAQCHHKGDDRGLAWNTAREHEDTGREIGRKAFSTEDEDARTEWLSGVIDKERCEEEARDILWAAARAEIEDMEDREPSSFFNAAAFVAEEFRGWI